MARGTPVRTRGRGARPTGPQQYPKALVTMEVKTNAVESLRMLENAIKEQCLRPAAHAGAIVFYNEMRQRVPVDEGDLFASIYRYHLPRDSGPTKQFYAIGPNKKKAPHWYNVEYGHWRVNVVMRLNGRWVATKERLPAPKWVPGIPYVRPTFEAKKQVALRAMEDRLAEKVREVMSGMIE